MTGMISPTPRFQFLSAAGIPLVGGTVTTYLAGTTTLLGTWQDQALTIANTNPIVLDARGECVIWLDGTKAYKFVLKNAVGVTQWTQDNINAATDLQTALAGVNGVLLVGNAADKRALSASTGSSLVGFLQAGTGAVARTTQSKIRDYISVKDFGALGDGVTDDTNAVQSALNYAETGGKVLRFPAGVYIISSALTVTNDSDGGITLEGESTSDYLWASGSVLKYTGAAGTMLTFDGTASPIFCKLKNMTFLGNINGDFGVKLNRGWFFNVEGCVFYNWSKNGACALALTYSTGSFVGVTTIRDCGFYNNTVGIYWEKNDVNVIRVEDCRFNAGTFGILQGASSVACSSRNVNIIGCMFDTVDAYAIYSWGGAQNWNIIGNYFEQNNAAVNTPRICIQTQIQSPQNCSITISGNTFSKQLNAASSNLVYLVSVNGIVIENNWSALGDAVDRYSVEMITCTNRRVMQFAVPSGSTPYPIKDDAAIYTTGSVEKMAGGMTIQSGINFPAVQSPSSNPNALDDYEEGSWTPVNSFVTFTTASGTYVKVGQFVIANFSVVFPVNAQGNQAEIIGLPYSASNGSANISYSDFGSGLYLRNSFSSGGPFFTLSGSVITNAGLSAKTVEGSFLYKATQ